MLSRDPPPAVAGPDLARRIIPACREASLVRQQRTAPERSPSRAVRGLGNGDLEAANLLAKASGQTFDNIIAKFKAGEGFGKIAHDMGLNLGKIVSDAHRSHPEQAKGKDEQSLIPGPGIRKNSILYTG